MGTRGQQGQTTHERRDRPSRRDRPRRWSARLEDLLGLEETLAIVSYVPMIMFAILLGLSMDHEVFLLSGIREEYLVDRDTVENVAVGIRSTARVITSAALVMIAVFLARAPRAGRSGWATARRRGAARSPRRPRARTLA